MSQQDKKPTDIQKINEITLFASFLSLISSILFFIIAIDSLKSGEPPAAQPPV